MVQQLLLPHCQVFGYNMGDSSFHFILQLACTDQPRGPTGLSGGLSVYFRAIQFHFFPHP